MRSSWKLGRVAGIDVFIHPTFLFVLFFPQVAAWGVFGLAVVLAGFGCVLLHELGHALMARRYGIATEDITLYPIGGVARLSRMPRSPGAELLIALAGPAVNFGIVAGLLTLKALGPWGFFADCMLLLNLVLGLFNLIPAFPMDGGRVLRALLSGWLGRVRATEIAAGLGRVLAVAFGFYSLLNGELMQVFLAGFIYMVAGSELASVLAEENSRRYDGDAGVWTAPPGYRWVRQGNGAWQLAPIVVTVGDGSRPRWN
jgi:Zn-dependent protease